MSTQIAENPAQATPEHLPAAQVDHDALYDALRRLLRCGRIVVRDIEANSSNVHRDLVPFVTALDAATALLDPEPLREAPQDAVVLFARSLREYDELWLTDEGVWAEVRGVHEHELFPSKMVQVNVALPDGSPKPVGLRKTEPVAVLRVFDAAVAP